MKQGELPEIRIRKAWLLRENVSKHLHELWGEGKTLADEEHIEKVVAGYQHAWKPHEKQILTAIRDVLGLTFRQNIIDVYVAPWFGAFSAPLIVGLNYDPDYFIDVLTHELIHRLFTDNIEMPASYSLKDEWIKLYGTEHSFKTRVHIPLHAVLKYVYLDVLQEPRRLERDVEDSKKSPDYNAAWDYVNKNDYNEMIKNLRNSYEEKFPQK